MEELIIFLIYIVLFVASFFRPSINKLRWPFLENLVGNIVDGISWFTSLYIVKKISVTVALVALSYFLFNLFKYTNFLL